MKRNSNDRDYTEKRTSRYQSLVIAPIKFLLINNRWFYLLLGMIIGHLVYQYILK